MVVARQIDGMDYIYICLNEDVVKETPEGKKEEQIYYEYDYKEISVPVGTLDLNDVKENPNKYLDYKNKAKTDSERIGALEETTDDIILMMADLIGGEI